MSDSAIAAIQGNVLHIPTVLGAIVITYSVPGVSQQLKFTPDLIADIFSGRSPSGTTPSHERQPRRVAPGDGHSSSAPLRRSGTSYGSPTTSRR